MQYGKSSLSLEVLSGKMDQAIEVVSFNRPLLKGETMRFSANIPAPILRESIKFPRATLKLLESGNEIDNSRSSFSFTSCKRWKQSAEY